MKRVLLSFLVLFALVVALPASVTAEEEEHPGEHPGEDSEGMADHVRKAIKEFIWEDTRLKGGHFLVWDEKEEQARVLDFVKFHEKVRFIKKKEVYFMCTDFKGRDGTVLDMDFWLKKTDDGFLKVTEVKIHKVAGKPRYTYDKDEMKEVE
ncbi:MAG: hypothetical protein V3W31_01020 [Thermodesulfobacteriota bacterium]